MTVAPSPQQVAAIEGRGVQCLVPMLEQQPLLRVHRRRLRARYAEAPLLEERRALDEAAVTHAARHGPGRSRGATRQPPKGAERQVIAKGRERRPPAQARGETDLLCTLSSM